MNSHVAIGALAIAAGFAMFLAPANAGAPPAPVGLGCTLVNDLSVYPRNGYYYYCGTNVATFKNTTASRWRNQPNDLNLMLQNNFTYLMLFDTKAEAESYAGGPLSSDYGVTASSDPADPSHPYVLVMVWESQGSDELAITLVHERGHALDFAYGLPSQNDDLTPSVFYQKVALDWNYINYDGTSNTLSRAQMFPRGVPNKKIDEPGGSWMDYDVGPAEGEPGAKTNQQIIEDLFPWIFGKATAEQKAELFAHLYQQSQNSWRDDCPYSEVPQTGGANYNYLEWQEVFGKFRNVSSSQSGAYFRTMGEQGANFTP